MNLRATLILLVLYLGFAASAQEPTPAQELPAKYLSKLQSKASSFEEKLDKQSDRILDKMFRREEKLYKKLAKKDSLKAKTMLAESKQKYQQLQEKLKNPIPGKKGAYIPYLDTLKTSLKFLDQESGVLSAGKKLLPGDISKTIGLVSKLEDQLKQADQVKAFIKQRRELMKDKLKDLGMLKELKKMNKEVYYYTAQVNEYKTLLSDPQKIEQKALQALQKLPAFKDFMQKNSQLASMFRLPGGGSGTVDPTNTVSLQGLQTRGAVQQQLQQQFGGPGGQQMLQRNMQQAQAQLSELKNKMTNLGIGGSGDMDMPDFKPNSQKTKSFKDRLEYGANIQSQPSNRFLPSSSELGLSIGYKINDKSVLGLGGSYRWGWGQPLKHLKITHEGLGLRSFIDWKIYKTFFVSGGYEQNLQSGFFRIEQLKDRSAWQESGLLGITKKYGVGKTKGNVQLLWDFLSYKQIPRAQPIKFRVGYTLK